MKRTRRLRELWNWLPVFRVVAETEHLPTAAAALFVSPASLSRSIGLLEENLGAPLFDRVGRGLRLNASGKALLDMVRDGMRAIDEGVSMVDGNLWSGRVGLWAERAYAERFLWPLLKTLRATHPNLTASVHSSRPSEVAVQILRGQVDVALVEVPPVHKQLHVEALQSLHYGLYCAPSSAYAQQRWTLANLRTSATFAIPGSDGAPGGLSHWPADLRPRDVVVVEDMSMAQEACHALDAIAALPEVVARNANMRRLEVDFAPDATLFAVYRKPVSVHPRTEALLELLRGM